MRVCILGDTHFIPKSGDNNFNDFLCKFYTNVFFPTLIEKNIDTIIQVGDLFDKRHGIDFGTLYKAKKYFFDKLKEHDIKMITLLGNHDLFYKESLSISSPELLLECYDNITVVTKPTTLSLNGCFIDIVPWVCKENYDESMNLIKSSTSDYLFGHFEISGFSMYKNSECHTGLEPQLFHNYKKVFSGHFHTKSTNKNIMYVGTPYEMTWSDYNDKKGFHIFDLDNNNLEFIENPYTIFHRFYYDDSITQHIHYDDFIEKYNKIIVLNKIDYYKFDNFVSKLYDSNVYEIKITEEIEVVAFKNDDVFNIEDTMSLVNTYIETVETTIDKNNIKSYFKMLYLEAMENEI